MHSKESNLKVERLLEAYVFAKESQFVKTVIHMSQNRIQTEHILNTILLFIIRYIDSIYNIKMLTYHLKSPLSYKSIV